MSPDLNSINIPALGQSRIVIIGGGFAGLNAAKHLENTPYKVVLLDKNNYHTFQPLLYQVATAGVEADSIVYPFRKLFSKVKNFQYRMANVERILPDKNVVQTDIGEIQYDYLIIATGSQTSYFGLEGVKQQSMPMKSIVEALNLRSCILQNFEKAVNVTDHAEKDALMDYIIVGGGPTGVELAGALSELKKHVLPLDYPELDFKLMQIHLIEASPRLLSSMDNKSSEKAEAFLKQMGVEVWLNTSVLDYDGKNVKTKTDKTFHSYTLIWAAGVEGSVVMGLDEKVINRGKRIEVDEYNKVKGYDNIFAIGDVAAMYSEKFPKGYPMLAQVAIQQGKLLAGNFVKVKNNQPLKSFAYKDRGSMATIGRNRAVAEIKKFKTQGFLAWMIWTFVHLIALVGFRNKVVVFVDWLWSYVNYDTGMRLIIRPFKKSNKG